MKATSEITLKTSMRDVQLRLVGLKSMANH